MNVVRHLRDDVPRFERLGIKAALEWPARHTAETIEALGPCALQPLHPIAQVRLRCLEHEMKVILHDRERMDQPAVA